MGRAPIIDPDAILDAAEQVILAQGVGSLTFEAVAARANISKGGLQYSFPSKAALIRAMVDRRLARLDDALAEAEKVEPDAPGRAARAYITASLGLPARPEAAALLAAVAADPGLLAGQREAYRTKHRHLIAGGTPPARAAALMLATDGLVLLDLLGLVPFDTEERAALLAELRSLATPPETLP